MKALSASSKLVIGYALEGGFILLKKNGTLVPARSVTRGKL
ncbi:hypothetical protein AB1K84_20440 [Mesobacillus foraminis]|nr:hypothetical protein [Mesobacillus foraminis]